MTIDNLKAAVRSLGNRYRDREARARRLFIEERAASLHFDRDKEFSIKTDISNFFSVRYGSIAFCGSGQLGFSIHKDRLFIPGVSDLDAAIIDVDLFQLAWRDIMSSTCAFSDLTPFGRTPMGDIEIFQQQILRRGMILVEAMPQSPTAQSWMHFQGKLSRKHTDLFKSISIAIYMNEYAFCWKQDSILSKLVRGQ